MHKSKGKLSGVLHKGFKPDKCKTSLRMAVARIKLLRNRKEAQVRQMRREVAQLLEANQDMTARIRVRASFRPIVYHFTTAHCFELARRVFSA